MPRNLTPYLAEIHTPGKTGPLRTYEICLYDHSKRQWKRLRGVGRDVAESRGVVVRWWE